LKRSSSRFHNAKKTGKLLRWPNQNVIEELDRTNRLVEELKPKLERAQLEVDQAKQDSELALIRVQEMEQRIDDEASVIA